MYKTQVQSKTRHEMIDITGIVKDVLKQHPIKDGICILFVPHTTAALTINENADPDVQSDLLSGLERLAVHKDYLHVEGNSDAHLKSSLLGCSQIILVNQGELVLGTWQGIFLAEFDGPRNRSIIIKIIKDVSVDD